MCKRLLFILFPFFQSFMLNAQNFDDEVLVHDFVEGKLCFTILDKTSNEAEVSGTTLKVEQEIKGYYALFDITIPASVSFGGVTYKVSTVANNAFRGCMNIGTVEVESGVSYIGNSAFENCGRLGSVNILEGVSYIGDKAFAGCTQLHTLSLPKSLTFVGKGSFSRCKSIKSISFPCQVKELDPSTFDDCSNLEAVLVDEENPYMVSVDGVLYDREQTKLICCPEARTAALIIPQTVTDVSWSFPASSKQSCISCSSYVPPVAKSQIGGSVGISLFVPKRSVSAYEQYAFWSRFVIRPY